MIPYFQKQMEDCYVIIFFETVTSELSFFWSDGYKCCVGISSILCIVFSAILKKGQKTLHGLEMQKKS